MFNGISHPSIALLRSNGELEMFKIRERSIIETKIGAMKNNEPEKCFLQASKKAGQFLQELWSVKANKFKPFNAAIPAILLGVISSSEQGERQE